MKSSSSSPERKIRFAVVGLGHIAQVAVLPGFKHAKHAELVALVSGDAKKLKKLAKQYDVTRTYSYEEFDRCLADPTIDAVYIALPNDLHCDCALRAAAAGKHILCEKPLADNLSDACLMTRVAEDHGVRLMTAYRLHFEPANLEAIELVRSGKLGEPRYFTASFSYQVTDPDNIRLQDQRGGGPIFDIGIYCLNAARQLMGDEATEVSAFFARSDDPRFREVEETAAVVLRFPRGRLASFLVSFGASSVSRCQLVGTKGDIVLEPAFEYAEGLKHVVTIDEKSRTKEFPHTDQFGGEIDAFASAILEKRPTEPSGEEGIADLRVISAIFQSARTGQAVKLPPFRRERRPSPRQVQRKPAVRKPEVVGADAPHD
ncbi:MAG TPA: Gfo/Idh/MocA family oxidoreductase [Candidatus Didemnitutus sp.]|nr:Gfo/Idh/MocA family oxidoreductase [Candidatus Didemnitutus sp.]